MKQTKCVSVIVPVYNMEAWLPRCIESILTQTHTDLQLILVDDGSADGSPAICDGYAEKDPRVTVVHQANGGVATAMNAGLDRAKGDFVLFVDSDDYIEADMIERLVSAQEQTGADTVQTGMSRVDAAGAVTEAAESTPAFFGDTEAILKEFFCGTGILLCLASKLFKKELFADFRFEPGRNIVDILATPFLLQACQTYQILSGAPYYAYFRADSVSRGVMTDKTYDDTLYYLDRWADFLRDCYPDNEEFRMRLLYRSCYEMSTRYALLKRSPGVSDKKAKLQAMRRRFRADYAVLKRAASYRAYPKKRRLMFALFSVSPWLMNTASALHSRL